MVYGGEGEKSVLFKYKHKRSGYDFWSKRTEGLITLRFMRVSFGAEEFMQFLYALLELDR